MRKPFEPLKAEFYDVQLGHGFYYVDAKEANAAIAQDEAVFNKWMAEMTRLNQLERDETEKFRAENERLKAKLAEAVEVIEWYANGNHVEKLRGGVNFDVSQMDWRVAHPYIGAVEYGQKARAFLGKVKGERGV